MCKTDPRLALVIAHSSSRTCFKWLSIENVEMDLIEFQGNNIWRNKCMNLNNELENNHSEIDRNVKWENLFPNEWKSILPLMHKRQ